MGSPATSARRAFGRLMDLYARARYHKGKRHFLQLIHRVAGPALVRSEYGPMLACYLTNFEQQLIYRNAFNDPLYDLIVRHIDRFDLFVDVGAHIGLFGLVAALESRGRVHCVFFEPSMREYRRLLTGIEANAVSGAAALPCAVGARTEFVRLQTAADHANTGMNQISDSAGDPVLQVPLDMLESLEAKRAFVKIDTEGQEYNVLLGARRFLAGLTSGFVVLEYTEAAAASLGYGLADVTNLMDGVGFKLTQRFPSPNGYQEDILFEKSA